MWRAILTDADKWTDEYLALVLRTYNYYAQTIKIARECCVSLGLPEDFFDDLSDESDWVFVIKVSGLFEAAIAQMITSALERPELEEVIHNLGYSGRNGKLEFCKSLNLLSAERLRFLSALSQIRNNFAHGLSSVRSTMIQYYESLPPDKQESFLARFCAFQDGRANFRAEVDRDERQRKLQFILFSESVLTLREIAAQIK